MHQTKTSKRKTFWRVALASTALVAGTSVTALLAGVTPASAAQLAHLANQPDTQIAVFMVPLTLLVLLLMFEVTRVVLRGLPTEAPAKSRAGQHWNSRRRDS